MAERQGAAHGTSDAMGSSLDHWHGRLEGKITLQACETDLQAEAGVGDGGRGRLGNGGPAGMAQDVLTLRYLESSSTFCSSCVSSSL